MKNSPLYNELRQLISISYENQLLQFLKDRPLDIFTDLVFPSAEKIRQKNPKAEFIINFHKNDDNTISVALVEKINESDFGFESLILKSLNKLTNKFLERNPGITREMCYINLVEEEDYIILSVTAQKEEN